MLEKLKAERTDRRGKAGGYASLGTDGLVPSTQLPSSQGTGAPVNASYVTISAESGLSNETLFATALDTYPHAVGGVAHSGTLDGNQLPAMSASKRGGVPPVGTATGAFLSSEGTWGVAGGGDMYKSTYDPNADGTIALAQLDTLVCSEAEADGKISTHGTVTVSVHNFDATGYAFPQAHIIGDTAHSGTLTDTQHGVRSLVGAHPLSFMSGTLGVGGHGDRSAEAGTLHGVAQVSGAESTVNKGVSGGYAPLVGTLVPTVNLGGAGASAGNFLRGDQTWQTPAGGAGETFITLSADRTSVATAFATITDLSFPVATASVYEFWGNLTFRTGTIITGIAIAGTGPATPLMFAMNSQIQLTLTTGTARYAKAYDSGAATPSVDVATSDCFAQVAGLLRTGTSAGTFALRFASEVANSTVTIRQGSVLAYKLI